MKLSRTITKTEDLYRLLQTAKGILITSHKDPDLDAVGASLGLWHWCRERSIPANVWLADTLTPGCLALPGAAEIVQVLPEAEAYDQVWVLDVANSDRVRDSGALQVFAKGKIVVNIDHHPDNTHFGQYNSCESISSTSELLFWVFTGFKGCSPLTENSAISPVSCSTGAKGRSPLTESSPVMSLLSVSTGFKGRSPLKKNIPAMSPDIATCLYAGICFDTGRFAHDNVTPETFVAAAELVAAGADLALIRREFFENKSAAAYALMRYVLNEMVVKTGYVYVCLPVGIEEVDIKAVDIIREIEGVPVAVAFRETLSDGVKVSLRSKGTFNVSTFSAQFGGGGHVKAAGITLDMSLDAAKTHVLAALEQAMAAQPTHE